MIVLANLNSRTEFNSLPVLSQYSFRYNTWNSYGKSHNHPTHYILNQSLPTLKFCHHITTNHFFDISTSSFLTLLNLDLGCRKQRRIKWKIRLCLVLLSLFFKKRLETGFLFPFFGSLTIENMIGSLFFFFFTKRGASQPC